MSRNTSVRLAASLISLCGSAIVAGAANGAEILVNNDINGSVTWTANNTYNLQKQIYVLPGATLTIEAGTVIASTTNLGGSLAVTRGAKIIASGTAENPIIFTSKADVATWVGGDPATGTWRVGANEWGNLTIMGRGYVSENAVAGNSATPNANNIAPMEGLVAAAPGDPNVLYGGGDDDDDSGTVRYCSFRYGGKVIGLNNELNGLSLGGIGRETDIDHIDIMNNVDDGIEIWGGTVNLKYFNIWNVGDDSLDIDQGWRGKAQFGLIVQGYSANAAQGSGLGDNAIEMDGAEQSDWQPVTTGVLYNLTVVGNPLASGGDHGTAWRDNCRMQIRNSIFMDLGERLVGFDNVDGDGGAGYGNNGTLSWANTWTTNYNVYSSVNAPRNPAAFYTSQVDGKLNEIKDSVFYRNLFATAYDEAITRGVLDAANNNVRVGDNDPTEADLPIRDLTRGALVSLTGGKTVLPVTGIDPRADPNNDAALSVGTAPNDGFFTQAQYRGAFPTNKIWICGWTAADAFGFVIHPGASCLVVADADGDGVENAADNCVNGFNPGQEDFDGDGVGDVCDNCEQVSNPDQADSNGNGVGDACEASCPADLNNSGGVDAADLAILLGAWGVGGGASDLNSSGGVDAADLAILLGAWGAC
ncbi:MAG: thrombospondin type 3 repeat-containing protein [Phycisphaerae bacterium]|jgi:hypothetical protein|nr:thrombospondin type 3 repeat-containing protein [Phycisphaerae bacterium]